MNAFKAVFLLCAVLGAASATQYSSGNGHRGWEGQQAKPTGAAAGTYGPQQGVQQQAAMKPMFATMATEAPASSASYGMFSSAPAGAAQAAPELGHQQESSTNNAAYGQSAPAAAAATTIQQVCTCITLPAAPQAPTAAAAPAAGPARPELVMAAPVAQQQNAYAAPSIRPQQQSQTSYTAAKAY